MLFPKTFTLCFLFLAPVLKSTRVNAKFSFAVNCQTEYWHKLRLMQNIFMINYILIQNINFLLQNLIVPVSDKKMHTEVK